MEQRISLVPAGAVASSTLGTFARALLLVDDEPSSVGAFIVAPEAARSRAMFERCEREVASLSALEARVVVRTLAISRFEGLGLSIVTDAPNGTPLGRSLQQTRPTRAESTAIIGALGTALEALHRVGVVHGDVGLETVMVGADAACPWQPELLAGSWFRGLAWDGPPRVSGGHGEARPVDDARALARLAFLLFTGLPSTDVVDWSRVGPPSLPPMVLASLARALDPKRAPDVRAFVDELLGVGLERPVSSVRRAVAPAGAITRAVDARLEGVQATKLVVLERLRVAARASIEVGEATRQADARHRRRVAAQEWVGTLETTLRGRLDALSANTVRASAMVNRLEALPKAERSQRGVQALLAYLGKRKVPSLAVIGGWFSSRFRLPASDVVEELRVALGVPASCAESIYAAGELRNVLAHREDYEARRTEFDEVVVGRVELVETQGFSELDVLPATLDWLDGVVMAVVQRLA